MHCTNLQATFQKKNFKCSFWKSRTICPLKFSKGRMIMVKWYIRNNIHWITGKTSERRQTKCFKALLKENCPIAPKVSGFKKMKIILINCFLNSKELLKLLPKNSFGDSVKCILPSGVFPPSNYHAALVYEHRGFFFTSIEQNTISITLFKAIY